MTYIKHGHQGHWMKHHEWPWDMRIKIVSVHQKYIIYHPLDDSTKLLVMDRNDADRGWMLADEVPKEEQDESN